MWSASVKFPGFSEAGVFSFLSTSTLALGHSPNQAGRSPGCTLQGRRTEHSRTPSSPPRPSQRNRHAHSPVARRSPPDRSPCQALKRRPCCWRSGCLSRRPLAGCTEPSSALSSQPPAGLKAGIPHWREFPNQLPLLSPRRSSWMTRGASTPGQQSQRTGPAERAG